MKEYQEAEEQEQKEKTQEKLNGQRRKDRNMRAGLLKSSRRKKRFRTG